MLNLSLAFKIVNCVRNIAVKEQSSKRNSTTKDYDPVKMK
uniref:Pco072231b n=1 Tax=Arundo donax TaxID=35708 RepID=A0A0A9DI74_ARUDO